MAEDSRLVELMAEMLIKQDAMVDELRKVNSEIGKLNLLSSENTRAIIKLADKIDQFVELEGRVKKLESVVFK